MTAIACCRMPTAVSAGHLHCICVNACFLTTFQTGWVPGVLAFRGGAGVWGALLKGGVA